MRGRLIFLLEEPSMKVLLDAWLPRLFNGWESGRHFLCIPHEGKNDLDRSIPRKLAGWRFPDDRFVIVRDNDNTDCIALKRRLANLCRQSNRPDVLIRLVCQELEGWYIGDLNALGHAFKSAKVDTPAHRKRYVNPDSWRKPSVEVKKLVPNFQKYGGARSMAQYLEPLSNRSHSLNVFVNGVHNLAKEMRYQAP